MRHAKLASCLIMVLAGVPAVQAADTAVKRDVPIVAVWIAWNDLSRAPEEIDAIPTDRINATMLSFVCPLKKPDQIAPTIKRLHDRGMKVIAFVCMELMAKTFAQAAAQRGETLPEGFAFRRMLNADGTEVGKFNRPSPITSFWDPTYRHYMEGKIRFVKTCGADFIVCAEWGYMTSDIRDFTEESLASFQRETGVKLPTTKLCQKLQDYLMEHKDVRDKWFQWKYATIYRWIATLGVDGVGRHVNGRGLVSPPFPGARVLLGGGGFGALTGTSDADYAAAENRGKLLKIPGAVQLGAIQFAVGNTGENTQHPEEIHKRAMFLAERVDGFVFYGASRWKRYHQYVQYLPKLEEYGASH